MRERKTEDSVRRNGHRTINIDLASHLGDIGNLMIPEMIEIYDSYKYKIRKFAVITVKKSIPAIASR